MCNPLFARDFFLHVREFLLFLGGATTFLVFAALAADGYFTDHQRYVYEDFTRGLDGLKNSSSFETLDAELNSTQCNQTIDGVTHFYNLTRVIPIGSLSNSSALFFVAPNVPGLAVVLIGAFALAQIAYTVRELVSNCAVVGDSGFAATRIIFFTHGQGLVQLLLQHGFYALVTFGQTVPLWKAFYVVFAMVGVFVLKNLYPFAIHCCCGGRPVGDMEMVLTLPHGILSFFAIIQVPIVIAKLGGTYSPSWAVALVPAWMAVLVNNGGWAAFLLFLCLQRSRDGIPFGSVLAAATVYLLYNCGVASSLILLCVNANPDYCGKSEWPYPWWRVVFPILVAYALLIFLQIGQLLGHVKSSLHVAFKRCAEFSTKQQKEADEHLRRTSLLADDAKTAVTVPAEEAVVADHLTAGARDRDAQAAGLTFVSTLGRQLSNGRSDRITEQMLLAQLRSLQQLVTTHSALVTSANRLLILQRFENYHDNCDEAEWSELVASRYAQLLRTFTKANVILNMFPALNNMRTLDLLNKPPLPLE